MRDRIIAAIALGVRRIADEHTRKGARGELMCSSGGCTRIAATAKDANINLCLEFIFKYNPFTYTYFKNT
jgi:hypothetical protein